MRGVSAPANVQRVLCSAAIDQTSGQPLPTEFRIFKRGVNTSSKGDFIFDDKAAASVMAAYRKSGVDLPLDLEHASLSDAAMAQRADAADARGWFAIEVRNGELWATNVTYTADGAERLTSRKQRYFSPAFRADAEGRVVDLLNVALVSQPALDGIAPLAASKRRLAAPTGACKALQDALLEKLTRTRKK